MRFRYCSIVITVVLLATSLCLMKPEQEVNAVAARVPIQTDDAAVQNNTYQLLQTSAEVSNLPASPQWALVYIDARDLWQNSDSGQNVVVAVLDTGIDDSCLGLAGKVIDAVNFSTSQTAGDVFGHGTEVASIIAGTPEQGKTAGVSYNCRLLNVKVANDDGTVETAALAQGIIWAASNGADIINISIQIGEDDPGLNGAVQYAWGKGCVIVAAAGNNVGNSKIYPAAYSQCISVTAVTPDGKLAPLSNGGNWVDVAAPGYNILTTSIGGVQKSVTGTSFAAAIVSGVAADLFFSTSANNNQQTAVLALLRTVFPTS